MERGGDGMQESPFRVNKTNDKSIVALVLGILALVVPYLGFILGIIAIVFARKAKNEINQTGEQGRGFATAGLVCGIVGTIGYGILLLFLLVIITFTIS